MSGIIMGLSARPQVGWVCERPGSRSPQVRVTTQVLTTLVLAVFTTLQTSLRWAEDPPRSQRSYDRERTHPANSSTGTPSTQSKWHILNISNVLGQLSVTAWKQLGGEGQTTW
ncbi:hypothetical protein E2C01_031300 [Portunus trituberculatus]|uniref:Uncharacterized protein n=1 Tax=Portunus trituberculatus TaxID=210409 RepID=A0A5B7EXR5_PORTR|nr:hypothetical protein [Portunus trituberculatus]